MKFTLLLLTSLLLSQPIFSEEILPTFCEETEKTLCNRPENIEKEELFTKLKTEIALEATSNAEKRYEKELPRKGLLKSLRTYIAKEKILNQEIIYAAERKLGHFEKDIVSDANVKEIKKYLTIAVEKSNLSEKYKNEFKKVINEKVYVGNYIDFMEGTNVTSSYFKQLWRAHCGMDGMTVNAFATTADKKKYVLVCPGLLVKLNTLKNSAQLNNEIFLILAHEISHHFDSGKFKKAYQPMAECYQREIAHNLNKRNGQKCEVDDSRCVSNLKKSNLKTKTKCNKRYSIIEKKGCLFLGKKWNKIVFKSCQKGTGENCRKTVTWKHLGEISADYWALKAMGQYMRDHNYLPEEGEEFLRVNFETLCGSGDEGIHADSNIRGNYLIGQNPVIRYQMSCLPPTQEYCEI